MPSNPEEDVMIPSGLTVTLDKTVECGELLIRGEFQVAPTALNLTCDSLIVQGVGAKWQVGTETNRHSNNLVVTLKGEPSESFEVSGHGTLGARAVLALMGGVIEIYGEDRVEWTHLAASTSNGASAIVLAESVDWQTGDEILLTSSRLNWNEAEKLTVASVSPEGTTIDLVESLSFPHSGLIQTHTRPSDNKQWTADLRAEVGLLSRNIRIQGAADSEANGFGAHLMIHGPMDMGGMTHPSGEARIRGVEFYRAGQKSSLGRYPFHWHLCQADGAGQYLKDSSIHRSYNRAIVIHGTDSALVENNFCYDHLGHGLFLEDGAERFNIIRRNVMVLTKRPLPGEEVTPSDNELDEVQNRTPASYWITNPNNIFEDNVAAGTQGTGYWFIMPRNPLSLSGSLPYFAGLEPWKEPLGLFRGNKAHSCRNGFDIFDQLTANHAIDRNKGWNESNDHVMEDCTWYSNDTAVYAGIGGGGPQDNVIYRDNVFVDNSTGLMLATYNITEDSLFWADSGENLLQGERKLYRAYDGAGAVRDCHFVGWDTSNSNLLQNTGAATKHVNHRFSGITTDHVGTVRASMTNFDIPPPADAHANHPGHPRFWSIVLRDEDGSLSGKANTSIIANHPFLRLGDEFQPTNWTNVYRSDRKFGLLVADQPDRPRKNVSVTRTKTGTPFASVYYINGYNEHQQLPVMLNEDFLYTYSYEVLPSGKEVSLRLDDVEPGDEWQGRLYGFGQLDGLTISGHNVTRSATLLAWQGATSTSYLIEPDGSVFVKIIATGKSQTVKVRWAGGTISNDFDSDGDGVSDEEELVLGRDPMSLDDLGGEFLFDDRFEGWNERNQILNAVVAEGAFKGTVDGDGSFFSEDFDFAASEVDRFLVRMKASVNDRVDFFWAKDGGAFVGTQRIGLDYDGSGAWQVLSFEVAGHPAWNGQINGLRFDPVETSGDFEVDWIRTSGLLTSGDSDGDGLNDFSEGYDDPDRDGLSNYQDTDSDGDSMSDGVEAATNRDPYDAGDLAFHFAEDANFSGWEVGPNLVDVSVLNGHLSGQTTWIDPQLKNGSFHFRADAVDQILVRFQANKLGSMELFFGTDLQGGFSGSRRVAASYATIDDWQLVALNVSSHPEWKDSITDLRIDPINTTDCIFNIDWFRASDGDLDQDGLADLMEGAADPDGDGLSNAEDSDSDGDGAPDELESFWNRDPYLDQESMADADFDGQSDLFEMIAGFSPDDRAASFLFDIAFSSTGYPEIHFSSQIGRRYGIEYSPDLSNWEEVASFVSGDLFDEQSWTDERASPSPRAGYYRISIHVLD